MVKMAWERLLAWFMAVVPVVRWVLPSAIRSSMSVWLWTKHLDRSVQKAMHAFSFLWFFFCRKTMSYSQHMGRPAGALSLATLHPHLPVSFSEDHVRAHYRSPNSWQRHRQKCCILPKQPRFNVDVLNTEWGCSWSLSAIWANSLWFVVLLDWKKHLWKEKLWKWH